MNTIERALLAFVLLSLASCSETGGTCETAAECRGDSLGYVCTESTCQECTADDECASDAEYGAGATCGDGRCEAGCRPGEEGCGCDEGACDGGLVCRAGMCAPPETGCLDCPCEGGSCDAGLVCEAGTCRDDTPPCPEGTEGCPCFSGGTCDGGLSCDASTSTCAPCAPGTSMCECDAGACGAGLACESSAMCPAGASECCVPTDCTEGTVGCTCSTTDPACGPGAVCRGGLCACGDNFAGANCEISCTDAQLMSSTDPIFNPAADQGFWLCGHFAASDHFEITTGGFTLTGEIPITPTDRQTLRGGTFTVTSR